MLVSPMRVQNVNAEGAKNPTKQGSGVPSELVLPIFSRRLGEEDTRLATVKLQWASLCFHAKSRLMSCQRV